MTAKTKRREFITLLGLSSMTHISCQQPS